MLFRQSDGHHVEKHHHGTAFDMLRTYVRRVELPRYLVDHLLLVLGRSLDPSSRWFLLQHLCDPTTLRHSNRTRVASRMYKPLLGVSLHDPLKLSASTTNHAAELCFTKRKRRVWVVLQVSIVCVPNRAIISSSQLLHKWCHRDFFLVNVWFHIRCVSCQIVSHIPRINSEGYRCACRLSLTTEEAGTTERYGDALRVGLLDVCGVLKNLCKVSAKYQETRDKNIAPLRFVMGLFCRWQEHSGLRGDVGWTSSIVNEMLNLKGVCKVKKRPLPFVGLCQVRL